MPFRRAAVFSVAFALVTIKAHSAGEPSYNGKKLSEWVRASRFGVHTEERAAIHQMGSNALPFLLEWMQYEPAPWREKAATAAASSKVVTRLSPTLPNTIAAAERTRLALESTALLKALHPDPVAVTNKLYLMLICASSSAELKLKSAQVLANVGRDAQIRLSRIPGAKRPRLVQRSRYKLNAWPWLPLRINGVSEDYH